MTTEPDALLELVSIIGDAIGVLWDFAERPDEAGRRACMPAVKAIAALSAKIVADDEADTAAITREILTAIFQPDPST